VLHTLIPNDIINIILSYNYNFYGIVEETICLTNPIYNLIVLNTGNIVTTMQNFGVIDINIWLYNTNHHEKLLLSHRIIENITVDDPWDILLKPLNNGRFYFSLKSQSELRIMIYDSNNGIKIVDILTNVCSDHGDFITDIIEDTNLIIKLASVFDESLIITSYNIINNQVTNEVHELSDTYCVLNNLFIISNNKFIVFGDGRLYIIIYDEIFGISHTSYVFDQNITYTVVDINNLEIGILGINPTNHKEYLILFDFDKLVSNKEIIRDIKNKDTHNVGKIIMYDTNIIIVNNQIEIWDRKLGQQIFIVSECAETRYIPQLIDTSYIFIVIKNDKYYLVNLNLTSKEYTLMKEIPQIDTVLNFNKLYLIGCNIRDSEDKKLYIYK